MTGDAYSYYQESIIPFDTGLWDPDYTYSIIPIDDSPARSRTSTPQAPSYETPYWVDIINRGIERAAQVATVNAAGYPSYPTFPTPSPGPAPGVQPQQPSGIHLSTNTLMILGLIGFAFVFGGRRR